MFGCNLIAITFEIRKTGRQEMSKRSMDAKRLHLTENRAHSLLENKLEKMRAAEELEEREEEKDKWVSENLTKERLRSTGVLQ
jgi:hypothetical protein